ncbi:SDR family oxidoreductase [Gordonia sp. zg691]|uniref:SDR family oxidoreductase n=1 Tax=Gordonia jinghuaiqii TaxID=2758710 RepID=A0A7D7LZZ6_9ACTN|nr:SDR family oxidoreductase [Gordonia jinghuaiqii]MBD0862074.1 SDR family oxidoreductase [Gordonia jinghuaiqii]MCR5978700.1 SDR family NAD(P)-dependent oxidoreductase [Gordonia jinghuaiqii]QMT03014.1 SDR family oxidoreductase [Gordonia jinghuaiqii]
MFRRRQGSVAGKVVFITGAARGIGRATATALVANGARVVLSDIDEQALDEVAASLGPDNAVATVSDVTSLADMQAAVDAGSARFGGIDMVVANAGIASYGTVLAVDPAAFRRVIDVNVTGVFHTVRAALPSVMERRGYVLIVSSMAAYAPLGGMSSYNASKAAVEHFANALRMEVGYRGVDVGSAHMSWIDTPLVQEASADLSAFDELLSRLPGPLSRRLPVEQCADAFVRGLAERKHHVDVPAGWVEAMRWLKPVLNSAVGDRLTRGLVAQFLPAVDADVATLHRSTSARNVAIGNVPPDAGAPS